MNPTFIKKLNNLSNIQIATAMLSFSVILVLLGAFVWHGNKSFDATADVEKITVAATIFPLADIVENVGGDGVEVLQLLPSGASPHAYDLTPSQVAELSKAEVLYYIGYGLDDWAVEYAESNNIPIMRVDKGIKLIESDEVHADEDEDDDHNEEGIDPHYWLTLPNGMIISQTIMNSLSEISPENAMLYQSNQNKYAAALGKTDIELRQRLNQLQGRNYAAFHGAWAYFSRGYGINIVAEFEEFPGAAPSPEYVANFQETIRANNVSTIFIEPQFSSDTIAPIAGDLGARLMELDPLGGTDTRNSYQELMYFNINQLIESE